MLKSEIEMNSTEKRTNALRLEEQNSSINTEKGNDKMISFAENTIIFLETFRESTEN
jgi:hypothetical protein